MRVSPLRQALALACAIVLSVSLTACVSLTSIFGRTEQGVDVNAVACAAFKPITWSVRDSDDTLRQIHEHNAAHEALCNAETTN